MLCNRYKLEILDVSFLAFIKGRMCIFQSFFGTNPSDRVVLLLLTKTEAISACNSLSLRIMRSSGPATLPRFNVDNCFAIPLTDIFISGLAGKQNIFGRISLRRWLNFK